MENTNNSRKNGTNSGTYKTVNQLAHEYALTKNGVMVRVRKMLKEIEGQGLNHDDYITRGARGTIYVLPKGLEWLAEWDESNSPMREPTPDTVHLESELEHAREKIGVFDFRRTINRRTIKMVVYGQNSPIIRALKNNINQG